MPWGCSVDPVTADSRLTADCSPTADDSATRPDRLVAVVGTGTEVGKTWVSARLLEVLRRSGHTTWARKPAQSFDPGDDPGSTDAAVLGGVTGEAPHDVCPVARWYPVAMAPPMAAEVLGRPPFAVADLLAGIRWPVRAVGGVSRPGHRTVGLVETAGGVRSPQADDGDAVDLVRLLAPDVVVLVADAGLGTIHAVRCCVDALAGVEGLVVVLNRFDLDRDLHRRNRRWLADRDGLAVVAVPGGEGDLARAVTG